jgi:branched-subunit amino acid ABC-type transport system permease component
LQIFIADIAFAGTTAAVLGLCAVSFALQYAVSNVVNLAFGEFLTLAAYFTYTLSHFAGMSLWLASVISVLGVGCFGALFNHFVIWRFVERGSNVFTIMVVTFAVSIFVVYSLVAIFGPDSFSLHFGGTGTAVRAGAFALTYAQLITIVIAVVSMLLLHALLRRTRIGAAMRAIVDDRTVAMACGVRVRMVTDVAWFVSGCFAGIAGLALTISTGTANNLLGSEFLLYIIPATFLGGLGSIYGAMIGAVLIAYTSDWGSLILGAQYKVVVALAVLLIVFMARPAGLIAIAQREG